jgi:hypothetical protein
MSPTIRRGLGLISIYELLLGFVLRPDKTASSCLQIDMVSWLELTQGDEVGFVSRERNIHSVCRSDCGICDPGSWRLLRLAAVFQSGQQS